MSADERGVLDLLSPVAQRAAVAAINGRYPAGWRVADVVPIATRFVARPRGRRDAIEPPRLPPIAEMLGSARRGAAARLRLYLWLHLLAGPAGDPVHVKSREWLRTLNLLPETTRPDGEVSDAEERNAHRQYLRALRHCRDAGWIARPRREVLRLLDPISGQTWSPPDTEKHTKYMKDRARRIETMGANVVREDAWFEGDPIELPLGCFASGAIGVLSGPGLAALLVLLDIGAHRGWTRMPYKRSVRYGIGPKAWYSGINNLAKFDWLETRYASSAGIARVSEYSLKLSKMRGYSHFEGWAPAWEGIKPARN